MVWYVLVGTNDFEKAVAFYDNLLAGLNAKKAMDTPDHVLWNTWEESCWFGVTKAFDGKPATAWNWNMSAFIVDSPKKVDEMYQAALDLGATDEGAPGFRGGGESFYGAYFRDLDGNKLNFFYVDMG